MKLVLDWPAEGAAVLHPGVCLFGLRYSAACLRLGVELGSRWEGGMARPLAAVAADPGLAAKGPG